MASVRLASLALVGVQVAALPSEQVPARLQFENFKKTYMKKYKDGDEEEYRFGVFSEALLRIARNNADPGDLAEYGVTRWTDRTYEELRTRCGGRCVGPTCQQRTARRGVRATKHAWDGTCYVKPRFPGHCSNQTLPDQFDWTSKGAVNPIKDQGDCGSCWAFGGTFDMEAAWFLAGNDLVALAEQQLTSCDHVGDDGGCNGGATDLDTDEYVSKHGLTSEKKYPYCSGKGTCAGKSQSGVCNKHLEAQPVAKFANGYQISGGAKHCDWCDKQPIDEELMKKHIVTAGPFTTAINAMFMDDYKKGIMNPSPKQCTNSFDSLDHQVAIVGYGTENGIDYWKVRNSWGPDWGESGYCRIVRGSNRCGIASDASHVVAKVEPIIV